MIEMCSAVFIVSSILVINVRVQYLFSAVINFCVRISQLIHKIINLNLFLQFCFIVSLSEQE